MAQVVRFPGADPVNAGEEKVLAEFASRLPESVRIFPNVLMRLSRQQLVECDQIIITDDRIWLVDVKDLYGNVQFRRGEHVVDGGRRSDPIKNAKLNAQRMKSRLTKAGVAPNVYVDHRIVLAKQPKSLVIEEEYAGLILSIDEAISVITDPVAHGIPWRGISPQQRIAAEQALALEPRTPDPRRRFGSIMTERIVAQDERRQLWSGYEVPLGRPWHVEVPLRPIGMPDADWEARRAEVLTRVRRLQVLSGSPGLMVPQTVAQADDGTLGIVHPIPPHPSLEDLTQERAAWSEPLRRRILTRIARAVNICQCRGIAHRTIGSSAILVDPEAGNAWLTRFERPHLVGTDDPVPPAAWAKEADGVWAAPEHFSGAPVGLAADLFALAGLAQELWPDGVPDDLAGPVAQMAKVDPTSRPFGLEALLDVLQPRQVAAMVQPAPGVQWAGYRLDEQLGLAVEAGVSVWRATSLVTGEVVVLRIYDEDAGREGAASLWSALQGVDHDALARVHAVDLLDERAYVVTQFVPGPSLRTALMEKGPLGEEAGVTAAVQLLDGLSRIHPGRTDGAEPIVHRRISLDSVIVNPDRGAVLVNFGPPPTDATQVALNEPRYRPPGEAIATMNPDIDLFAVAVLLHEMITGVHPFTGEDPVDGELEVHSDLSTDLRVILERALDAEPDRRFPSAQEFLAALLALGLPHVRVPLVAEDLLDIQRRIESALRERRWDEADRICPAEWGPIRAYIQEERARWEAIEGKLPLIIVEGFALSLVEEWKDVTVTVPGVGDCLGDDRIYLAAREDGMALEVAAFVSAQGDGTVRVTRVVHADAALERLKRGLRIGVRPHPLRPGLTLDLEQARFPKNRQPNDDASHRRATVAELDAGAGVDVGEVLARFGIDGYGTREQVLGDTGPRRNVVCATFPRDALDVPAIAYLLTRIVPIVRDVRHHS